MSLPFPLNHKLAAFGVPQHGIHEDDRSDSSTVLYRTMSSIISLRLDQHIFLIKASLTTTNTLRETTLRLRHLPGRFRFGRWRLQRQIHIKPVQEVLRKGLLQLRLPC